jgi:hypothetical protein
MSDSTSDTASMSGTVEDGGRRDQRIVHHIRALQETVGLEGPYASALNAVRDDSRLNQEQREAIYKTLAQQSLLWYIEACTGKPVSLADIEAKMTQGKKS